MLRRFFAFLLAFLMVFSSVPTQALAAMIHEEPAAEGPVVTASDGTTAPVDTTAAVDAHLVLSETTASETTGEESVPETTVKETVPATTAAETVPATTVETIPETTAEEKVPETTAEETVPPTTTETVPETTVAETVEVIIEENIHIDPLADVTLTGNWAADTLAIAQSYEGYTQETDEDGNPYTVFGAHFDDAANTYWNTHFIAY